MSIVSTLVGVVTGVTGSTIAVLSFRESRRLFRDRAGHRRPVSRNPRWHRFRLIGIVLACLGGALASAILVWNLAGVTAFAMAVALLIISVGALGILLLTKPRTVEAVATRSAARTSVDSQSVTKSVQKRLTVDREEATVSLEGGSYRLVVRRWLVNLGSQPVTEFAARVAVDRFPDRPFVSRKFYRQNPLTLEEIGFSARLDGRPVRLRPVWDHDSAHEVWLLFEDENERFPLYPGDSAVLEYTYSIGINKWGPFFQRSIQLPTHSMRVDVRLPPEFRPKVWGTIKNSAETREEPLEITSLSEDGFDVFRSEIFEPQLYAVMVWRWQLTYRDSDSP